MALPNAFPSGEGAPEGVVLSAADSNRSIAGGNRTTIQWMRCGTIFKICMHFGANVSFIAFGNVILFQNHPHPTLLRKATFPKGEGIGKYPISTHTPPELPWQLWGVCL
jgi:hypothetical protein